MIHAVHRDDVQVERREWKMLGVGAGGGREADARVDDDADQRDEPRWKESRVSSPINTSRAASGKDVVAREGWS